MKATLILANGSIFSGTSIGSTETRVCEMVFNTSMTGYQEILTDPSYAGQGVVMSYPLIGNYGVNSEDNESSRPWVEAFVVRHLSPRGSNFRCEGDLGSYLKEHNITGIQGVDTRALTKILRSEGSMNGMLTCAEHFNIAQVLEQLKAYKVEHTVSRVTRSGPEVFPAYGEEKYHVAMMDYGVKQHMIECLRRRGCRVTALPASTPAETVLAGGYDGVMLSNGPGDPAENTAIIAELKKLYQSDIPMFGVCLGHQLLALATGAKTGRLAYGHRGGNHPVRDIEKGRVFITSQNHGYMVLADSVDPAVAEVSHVNVNDGTCEGLRYRRPNCFTTQFHPEANAGPKDTEYLFNRFIDSMASKKRRRSVMPKYTDVKKVLVLGSGPIVIGQAAEFDYAGTQACRALKEEGLEVVLVNSNPATIMTDKDIADHVYIEPLNIPSVTQVIQMERPDSILPTLGGQTGLNLAMALHENGTLEKYGVRLLGTSPESIRKAEDRQGFKDCMESIDQPCVTSLVVESVKDAVDFAESIGYPVIVRPAYTLGGTGGGIAYDRASLEEIAGRGIALSRVGQVLIERCIAGWKEIEFEVMRDGAGNVITICSMENIDPVGVHTGDSIVVAPAQTLANKEFQMLRSAALDIISALEIEGGCNVQFALNPDSFEYAVIEVNPRVSRSSALASKATGYPIAKVAAKVALGYTLDEIPNAVTGKTTACFEPTIDYCVLKIPRLPFDKFTTASRTLGTQMKATGEVMAIANSFEGAMMKAIRSLELNVRALKLDKLEGLYTDEIEELLVNVTDERLFVVAEALRRGFSPQKIYSITKMDIWFLDGFKRIIDMEEELKRCKGEPDVDTLKRAKEMCFADSYIGALCGMAQAEVKALREKYGIIPAFKMVDTCAAEFDAETPYYYSTYDGENEARDDGSGRKKVLVLGSGPIRIGQGIEFDYCSVHSVWALKKLGCETIIVNNNPETVSTDFDVADKLYFEPLTAEDVQNIVEQEKPWGAVVQFGGQTAIKLAKALTDMGVQILGTSSDGVDAAEDRERFDEILSKCSIPRAKGKTIFTTQEALNAAHELGYPVLVRPSYVLGGQGMEIAYSDRNIEEFMRIINMTVQEHPILVDKYLMGRELEVDGVFDGEDILIPGIMEHVERAGVHSGDSIAVYPPLHLEDKHRELILQHTKNMAKHLGVIGLINAQYILYDDDIYVIEVNPRSSRTIPYISKVTGVPIIDLATRVMLGEKLKDMEYGTGIYKEADYFAVKAPVFSFEKLTDVDTGLGPEMKSTGEVLGLAETYPQALLKAFKGSGMRVPKKGGRIIITVKDEDKRESVAIARGFEEMGVELYATAGTCQTLTEAGIECKVVNRVSEAHPNILDMIASGTVDLIINTPTRGRKHDSDGFRIRRSAVEHGVGSVTAIDTARALLTVRQEGCSEDLTPIDITKI